MSHTPKKKHKLLRIAGIVLLIMIFAAGGGWLWLSQHYKPIIRKKLPEMVAKATDSLYRITFSDVDISLAQHKVSATNVHFFPDTNVVKNLRARHRLPSTLLDISLPTLDVTGVDWSDAAGKKVSCQAVLLQHPEITVTVLPKDSLKVKDTSAKKARIDKIEIAQILFRNGNVTYKNATDKDTETVQLRSVSATMNHWEFEPGKEQDTSRIFFAADATLSVDTIRFRQPDALYVMKVGAVSFNSKERAATIKDFSIMPALSEAAFYKQVGHQADIFHVSFPLIKIDGLAWPKLLYDGILSADNVILQNMNFSDYFSRYPPLNKITKLGNYPQQVLMRIKLPINIRAVHAYNTSIKYTELNNITAMAGSIGFTRVKGIINNVTNMPEALAHDANCTIQMDGFFQDKSPISAAFRLLIPDKKGKFSIDAVLQNVDAAQINPTIKALALAEMKSMHITRLDAHVEGNEVAGSGNVKLLYNDLKLELQKVTDKKTDDGDKLKDRHVLSFIANKLILFPDNPMEGKEVRTASNVMVRDQYKSFFSLIWKNILAGAIKTIIRNDKLADSFAKKQEKGAQTDDGTKKKSFLKKLFGKNKSEKKIK